MFYIQFILNIVHNFSDNRAVLVIRAFAMYSIHDELPYFHCDLNSFKDFQISSLIN